MRGNILVLPEMKGEILHPISFELLGKAQEIAGDHAEIHCLLLGKNDLKLDALIHHGADLVYYMADDCFTFAQEELYEENIVKFIRKNNYDIILCAATKFGRSLAPRIAAALKTGLTADCTQLALNEAADLVQIRPAFSGNILAHILSNKRPQMATIRYKEFKKPELNIYYPGKIERITPYLTKYDKSHIVQIFDDQEVDISESDLIVAGGRGIRKAEDLQLLKELADLLGAELGVSRALVDNGFAKSVRQIGYSGKRVKARLYIACGISGSTQHIAGIRDVSTLVAINSDRNAAIFSVCDYGIVGDLYNIIPRMIEDLKSLKDS